MKYYDEILNNKSILNCYTDKDIEQHNTEISKIFELLQEKAKAGAVLEIAYTDPGHRDDEPEYLYIASEDYNKALDGLDSKNGIDFAICKGDLSAVVYGQNYKYYNSKEECMEEAVVRFHLIDEKQSEHIHTVENCLNFIDKTELKNEFLSIVFRMNDFFMASEKLIEDLKKSINPSLENKLNDIRNRRVVVPTKQCTYQVIARTPEEKKAFLESSLCIVRDWKMGMFDIPARMYEEFKERFGIVGYENSVCRIDITKDDIRRYNSRFQHEFER